MMEQADLIPLTPQIPAEISDYPLFLHDRKFIRDWVEFRSKLEIEYPELDVATEIAGCHKWKVTKGKPVKCVKRTLGNWFKKAREIRKGLKMDTAGRACVHESSGVERVVDPDVASSFQRHVRNKRPRL